LTALVTNTSSRAIPACSKRAIENPAGRTDERFASQVFLIAGLLAHKHQGAREVAPRPEQPALQIYRAGSARNGLLRREERPAF
jgi:hypothetical protein